MAATSLPDDPAAPPSDVLLPEAAVDSLVPDSAPPASPESGDLAAALLDGEPDPALDPVLTAWEWLDEPASPSRPLVREVLVQLGDGRATRADAHDLPLTPRETVLLEGEEGTVSGVLLSYPAVRLHAGPPLPRIIRRESGGDRRREELQRQREEEAFRFCRQRIQERRLEMKLVRVPSQANGNKLTFLCGC